jgi:hypothetical protein
MRYRKPRRSYSRFARILKRRLALRLAPTVDDFDLDRPRLGLSDTTVASHLRPHGDVLVVSHRHINRASAAATAPPATHQEVAR